MKVLISAAMIAMLASCCVTVNLAYTQGDASDVIDDNDTIKVSAPLKMPLSSYVMPPQPKGMNGPSAPDRPQYPSSGNGPSSQSS